MRETTHSFERFYQFILLQVMQEITHTFFDANLIGKEIYFNVI